MVEFVSSGVEESQGEMVVMEITFNALASQKRRLEAGLRTEYDWA